MMTEKYFLLIHRRSDNKKLSQGERGVGVNSMEISSVFYGFMTKKSQNTFDCTKFPKRFIFEAKGVPMPEIFFRIQDIFSSFKNIFVVLQSQ